jgi:hypothetical protein
MASTTRQLVRKFSHSPALSTAQHFPAIGKIKYEGPSSTNPLAFKHFKADEVINGKVSERICK